MRILLAEDEKELSRALEAILRHRGYEIDVVYDGQDAIDYALACEYDCLIFDIMMPKKSGLVALAEIRAAGCEAPVLLLTAKSQTEDKIEGLDAGADDYLTKPFVMGELLARIRALTRRKPQYLPDVIAFGNIKLDKDSAQLHCEDKTARLTGKELALMTLLIENPQKLFSTDQLMEKIWGFESESEINVVWVCISSLRKKLMTVGANVLIKAARGVGYSLELSEETI